MDIVAERPQPPWCGAVKRSYGYRIDQWHATVPEGKLWNAVCDHEQAKRAQAALNRHRVRG